VANYTGIDADWSKTLKKISRKKQKKLNSLSLSL